VRRLYPLDSYIPSRGVVAEVLDYYPSQSNLLGLQTNPMLQAVAQLTFLLFFMLTSLLVAAEVVGS